LSVVANIGASLAILVAWLVLLDGRRRVRGTTLTSAQIWSFLAATAWTSTWITDRCLNLISPALADHLWYGCAILALCPPISVLGSRRPGTRVWTWFILLPMLLALCWPIAALWLQGSELRRLQLETPQLIAVALVLVMGVGNYCGTTYTVSALLYGCAILALVFSSSAKAPNWLSDRESTRFWVTVVTAFAILLLKVTNRPPAATKFDQLWFDFFDTFGIVWGRRIQDRVNYIASDEHLPFRLELHGFVWSTGVTEQNHSSRPSAIHESASESRTTSIPAETTKSERPIALEVEARVEHVLRWLLRRFVDSEWIDERLGSKSD
jgi:hypothetical protein